MFFFFSSRRRHTRCLSDWSSDVCSSDLSAGASASRSSTGSGGERPPLLLRVGSARLRLRLPRPPGTRSEERRVGKECRSRWWQDQYNKAEEISSGGHACKNDASTVEYTR